LKQGLATNETTKDDAAKVLEMLRNRLEEVVNLLFNFIFFLLNINMALNMYRFSFSNARKRYYVTWALFKTIATSYPRFI
jgi:hypothetical protein